MPWNEVIRVKSHELKLYAILLQHGFKNFLIVKTNTFSSFLDLANKHFKKNFGFWKESN